MYVYTGTSEELSRAHLSSSTGLTLPALWSGNRMAVVRSVDVVDTW